MSPTDMTPDDAETARDWESIQVNEDTDRTERLRVAGGWLYRTILSDLGVALAYAPAADEE